MAWNPPVSIITAMLTTIAPNRKTGFQSRASIAASGPKI
jgi:hypothetical protein